MTKTLNSAHKWKDIIDDERIDNELLDSLDELTNEEKTSLLITKLMNILNEEKASFSNGTAALSYILCMNFLHANPKGAKESRIAVVDIINSFFNRFTNDD